MEVMIFFQVVCDSLLKFCSSSSLRPLYSNELGEPLSRGLEEWLDDIHIYTVYLNGNKLLKRDIGTPTYISNQPSNFHPIIGPNSSSLEL